MRVESGIDIKPGDARRNIVTTGVDLNALIGREFRIGEVRLRGVRPCEPCSHLEKLTKRGIKKALAGRGGLRAEILFPGKIRFGDPVEFNH